MVLLGVIPVVVSGCGACAGVGLARLRITEKTIAVGQSFVAVYEEGGSCDRVFEPRPGLTRWTTTDTTIVRVDSVSGRVTGLRVGDARVTPTAYFYISEGPTNVVVHVR
jgi:hypothetical protein